MPEADTRKLSQTCKSEEQARPSFQRHCLPSSMLVPKRVMWEDSRGTNLLGGTRPRSQRQFRIRRAFVFSGYTSSLRKTQGYHLGLVHCGCVPRSLLQALDKDRSSRSSFFMAPLLWYHLVSSHPNPIRKLFPSSLLLLSVLAVTDKNPNSFLPFPSSFLFYYCSF